MTDIVKDSDQFLDYNEDLFQEDPFEGIDCPNEGFLEIKPEDGIFNGQTQTIYALYCGSRMKNMAVGLNLNGVQLDEFELDPVYSKKIFIPTFNDMVKILLKCTSDKIISSKFLQKFRQNFASYYIDSSKARWIAEANGISMTTSMYNYSNEIKNMFSGKFAAGLFPSSTRGSFHGINAKDHPKRFQILKTLVANNKGDFGNVVLVSKLNKANEKFQNIDLILDGGIAISILEDALAKNPKNYQSHIGNIEFYAPFDIQYHYSSVGKDIPRSILQTAYDNLLNGYCKADN